jgi:hypothetical protein
MGSVLRLSSFVNSRSELQPRHVSRALELEEEDERENKD